MKVFLSWSGTKSRAAAEAVREWLPFVINAVDPWMSAEDIGAGARWSAAIQSELEHTKFGVLFVTAENTSAPWLLFEAGALAKTLNDTFVCPYLLGLRPAALPNGPLSQFQAKEYTETGTWQLVQTINRALDEDAIPEDRLTTAFQKWWPDLKGKLSQLPEDRGGAAPTERGIEDMVEELLSIARRLDSRDRDREVVYSGSAGLVGERSAEWGRYMDVLRNIVAHNPDSIETVSEILTADDFANRSPAMRARYLRWLQQQCDALKSKGNGDDNVDATNKS